MQAKTPKGRKFQRLFACLMVWAACWNAAGQQMPGSRLQTAALPPVLQPYDSLINSLPGVYLVDQQYGQQHRQHLQVYARLRNNTWLVTGKNDGVPHPAGTKVQAVFKLMPKLVQVLNQGIVPTALITLSHGPHPLPPNYLPPAVPATVQQSAIMHWQNPSPHLLAWLLAQPQVVAIDLPLPNRQATEEFSVPGLDLSANGTLLAQARWPQLRADSIRISVKERSLDSTDIDLAPRYFYSGLGAPTVTQHATTMGSIIAGAGNSSPQGLGVAPAARLTSTSFASLLPEPAPWYRQQGITLQNHSYGVGVESNYGIDAAAYDLSTWQNQNLLHVFSAGNAGTQAATEGTYQQLPGWANLTGSFKMSKNSLVVGAVDSFNVPEVQSSAGPANDGRLKPELVAFGEDGSSGAAAIATGAAALLQQYLLQKQGSLPPASLVKALLVNSAIDIGQPGPDYKTGYGLLQIHQAIQMATQGQYQLQTLSLNEATLKTNITVPPGQKYLQVSLCYTDTPGLPNAPIALQNDLDLQVVTPAGDTLLPWVLQTQPNAAWLALPATRGRDSLNNTEQITLANPLPGQYTLLVKAHSLITTQQPFALAWHWQAADTLQFLNPVQQAAVPSPEGILVRWQQSFASGTTGTLSLINLLTQQTQILASNIPLQQACWRWSSVPALPMLARLRMQVQGSAFWSDSFVVAPAPSPVVGYLCPDSTYITWPALPGIDTYQVLRLNSQGRMQPEQTVTDTQYLRPTAPDTWLTVVPIIANKQGPPAFSFNPQLQGNQCFVRSFTADYVQRTAHLQLQLGTLATVQQIRIEKLLPTGFSLLQQWPASAALQFEYTDAQLQPGANIYRATLLRSRGAPVVTQLETVMHSGVGNIWLYPNPMAQGQRLSIINSSNQPATITVYDATGRRLLTTQAGLQNTYLPTQRLAKGLYWLVATPPGGAIMRYAFVVN